MWQIATYWHSTFQGEATSRPRPKDALKGVSVPRYVRDSRPRESVGNAAPESGANIIMGFLLWIIAVILVVAGIVTLIGGSILWGIVLIVVGLAVGPGGWSIFNRSRA